MHMAFELRFAFIPTHISHVMWTTDTEANAIIIRPFRQSVCLHVCPRTWSSPVAIWASGIYQVVFIVGIHLDQTIWSRDCGWFHCGHSVSQTHFVIYFRMFLVKYKPFKNTASRRLTFELQFTNLRCIHVISFLICWNRSKVIASRGNGVKRHRLPIFRTEQPGNIAHNLFWYSPFYLQRIFVSKNLWAFGIFLLA